MKRFVLVGVGLFVLLILSLLFLFNIRTSKEVKITINKGQSINSISQKLASNGLVPNSKIYLLYLTLTRQRSHIRAGQFTIPVGSNIDKVTQIITSGGRDDYVLIIKPGSRVEEIDGLPEGYVALLSPKIGYLYPETYLVPRNYSAQQLEELIINQFERTYSSLLENNIANQKEVVIVASLLEREAKTLNDKKIVAGIIKNRLQAGMPLQIDAAVQFSRDSVYPPKDNKYWKPLLKQELQVRSPYNTYLFGGLPPGPICNPGKDSLIAALNPISSKFLFYISDTSGSMHYAVTLEDHNSNIQKYLK